MIQLRYWAGGGEGEGGTFYWSIKSNVRLIYKIIRNTFFIIMNLTTVWEANIILLQEYLMTCMSGIYGNSVLKIFY